MLATLILVLLCVPLFHQLHAADDKIIENPVAAGGAESPKASADDKIRSFIHEYIWKTRLKLEDADFLELSKFRSMEMFEGENFKDFDKDEDGKISLEEMQDRAVSETPQTSQMAQEWADSAAYDITLREKGPTAEDEAAWKAFQSESGGKSEISKAEASSKGSKRDSRRILNDAGGFVANPKDAYQQNNAYEKCDVYARYSRWACNNAFMSSAHMAGKVKEDKLRNLSFRLFNRINHVPAWENHRSNVCKGDVFYGMGTAVWSRSDKPQFKGWAIRYKGQYPKEWMPANTGWDSLKFYFNRNFPVNLAPLLRDDRVKSQQHVGPLQMLNYLWNYPDIVSHCQQQQGPNNKKPMIHFIINKEIFFYGEVTYYEISTIMSLWPHLDVSRKEGIIFWLLDDGGKRARIYGRFPDFGWQPDPDIKQAVDALVAQERPVWAGTDNPDTYRVTRSV